MNRAPIALLVLFFGCGDEAPNTATAGAVVAGLQDGPPTSPGNGAGRAEAEAACSMLAGLIQASTAEDGKDVVASLACGGFNSYAVWCDTMAALNPSRSPWSSADPAFDCKCLAGKCLECNAGRGFDPPDGVMCPSPFQL